MEEDSGQNLLSLIKSLIRKKPSLDKGSDLADEIQDLISEGQAKGLISGEESDMVHGVLDLKETTAHEIMIPRTEISSSSINSTLDEIIKLVATCGHTRIPIYKDNIDEIVGTLHAKDLLKLWGQDVHSIIPSNLLRKPYFVPGNQKASEVLKKLKEKKTHLAIVTDEYGGTAGIITIEDIIEEIVGEIMDEHDNEPPRITTLDDNTVMVDARLEIEKLEEHFAIELPEGEFESVGGFIIHLLGKIPKVGDKIVYQDLTMIIKSADQRKIDKIHILRNSPSQEATIENNQH
ncbi:hemolysin family protein [Thermodesulfobacteriota bacterium]